MKLSIKFILFFAFTFVALKSGWTQPISICTPINVSLDVESTIYTQLYDTVKIPKGVYITHRAVLQKSAGCAANLGFQMSIPKGTVLVSASVPDPSFVCQQTSDQYSCLAGQFTATDEFAFSIALMIDGTAVSFPSIDTSFELIELPLGGDINPNDDKAIASIALSEFCGNGLRENFEACDDQNVENGDGCSSKCAVENLVDTKDALDDENNTLDPSSEASNLNQAANGCSLSKHSESTPSTCVIFFAAILSFYAVIRRQTA